MDTVHECDRQTDGRTDRITITKNKTGKNEKNLTYYGELEQDVTSCDPTRPNITEPDSATNLLDHTHILYRK